jgi:hypothetical protein
MSGVQANISVFCYFKGSVSREGGFIFDPENCTGYKSGTLIQLFKGTQD